MTSYSKTTCFYKFSSIVILLIFCAFNGSAQSRDTTVLFKGQRYDAANPANNIIVNPERGFRDEIMFEVSGVRAPMWGMSLFDQLPSKIANTKSNGGTVIQTYFYLYKYYNTNIPDSAITNMKTILDVYRKNGMKALLRFAYDWGDPPITNNGFYPYSVGDIVRHIGQLKNFMEQYKDVIYAFQFGWIGDWGEWHDSYYKHENYPDAISVIVNTFLNAMPETHKVTIRQPSFKNEASLGNYDYWNRVGFNNDYFTLDVSEHAQGNDFTYWYYPAWPLTTGGYKNPDYTQIENEAFSTIMDGEMPYTGSTSWHFNVLLNGFTAYRRLAAHNYSTFSYIHNLNLNIASWKNQWVSKQDLVNDGLTNHGYDPDYFLNKNGNLISRSAYELIRDFLGYRLKIKQATYPLSVEKGNLVNVSVDLQNVGIAAPIKARNAQLVLLNATDSSIALVSRPVDFSITLMRTAADIKKVKAELETSGLSEGHYLLGLWLPDACASIHDSASYSIRLANEGVSWYGTNNKYGINVFGSVDIQPSTTVRVAPGGVVSSTSLVNGLRYELYSAYRGFGVSLKQIENRIYGNFSQAGYTSSPYDFDKNFEAKSNGYATIVMKGKINILSAGTYEFSMPGIDDYGVMLVDGQVVFKGGWSDGSAITPITIPSAGLHDIEIRFSNIGGAGVCRPMWRATAGGYDLGNGGFVRIPDNRFFTNASIGQWYAADKGVVAGTAVTAWADQAGNPYNTNLTGVNGPVYQPSSDRFNFNPVIQFNSAQSQYFKSALYGNNLAFKQQDNTMITVGSLSSINSSNDNLYFLSTYGSNNGNRTESELAFRGSGKLGFAIGGANGYVNTTTSNPAVTVAGQPVIGTGVFNNYNIKGSTAALWIYANGVKAGPAGNDNASNKSLNEDHDLEVGASVESGKHHNGGIAEVINYPWALSESELQRVHSYLAVKYGITLGSPAAPFSYTNSNGDTIWQGDVKFQQNIAGIGRDDNGALLQKQSRSTAGAINEQLTIGVGELAQSNAANSYTIATDKSYLVWGDNGQRASLATDISNGTARNFVYNGSGANQRMRRIWKAQSSGFTDQVKVSAVAISMVGSVQLNGACSRLCLVAASDSNFTTGVTATPLTLEGGNYVCKTSFTSGVSYFTLAKVLIKSEGEPYLPLVANTSSGIYSICTENGWRYFYSDATPSGSTPGPGLGDGINKLFAIKGNSNLPEGVQGTVSFQPSAYNVNSGANQLNIMGRLLTVNAPAGSNIKVRVYYSGSEQAASLAPGAANGQWFLYTGTAAATVNANNGDSITGAIIYNNPVTGTEDGVSYVELDNINTPVATLGYMSKSELQVQSNRIVTITPPAAVQNNSKPISPAYKTTTIAPATTATAKLEKAIKIYPNPAQDVVNVVLSGYSGTVGARLINMHGQVVQTIRLKAGTNQVPCNALAAGIYNLIIDDLNGKPIGHIISIVR